MAGRSRPDTEKHGGATRCFFEARMWGHMSTTDLPGSSLLASRYRLVERLGAGGMSVVWRGFDEVLGRQVAVKVLPPSTSADPAFRRRLRAEAQAAARLSHPNITNVYDYGEATTVDGEPVPYVVMELIDGESLAAVLARARKLPWQHAVRITAEVAAALAAAHARGIVHRDVTPANVMLTPTGAKVVDFGISALIGENDIDPDGSLLGTPAYLAPERLEGGQVSPATDVYAVGLLIYRTLIGQLPWDVGTTTALLRAHQYTEPEPLPAVDGLPPEVDALVGRCLEKRPADRPSSAELARVLAAISAGAPSVARGYVPDWKESGEDTTILPSPHSYAEIMSLAAAGAAAAGADETPAAAAEGVEPDGVEADGAASPAPARNSKFGDLESRPVDNAAPAAGHALRPAYGNQPPDAPVPASGADAPNRGIYMNKTRRVLVVTLGVLLLGIGTYGWTFTGSAANEKKDSGANATPIVIPPTGKCVVSYSVMENTKGRFTAQVTLANRATMPVSDWTLDFIMPGDQVLSSHGNTSVHLVQTGRGVSVSSEGVLDAQKTITVPVTGRYTTTNNTAPLAFQLNQQTCETFVSPAPGQPSRKVEHLSDGTTRLSIRPASSSPGITIGPSGIVTIAPTVGPSSSVSPSQSTAPGEEPPPPSSATPSTSQSVSEEPPPPPPPPTSEAPSSSAPASSEPPPTTTPPQNNVECDPDVAGDCPVEGAGEEEE